MVSSIALTFPSEDTTLDTERALPSGYPSGFPAKTTIMELSRLCIDPEYQKGDILIRIFEHAYRVFSTSGREVAITSSDDTLWPTYEKIGFKKTGLTYPHPVLNGIPHHILRIDRRDVYLAKGISFLTWFVVYSRMTEYLWSTNAIELSFFEKLRVSILLKVSKILGLMRRDRY